MTLAFGWADVAVYGEFLTGAWKIMQDWGTQPGVWLIVVSAVLSIAVVWKWPKPSGDDTIDDRHPIVQIVLKLITSIPLLVTSLMAAAALTFGILDLMGMVPLREKRADFRVEQLEKRQEAREKARSAQSGDVSAPRAGIPSRQQGLQPHGPFNP